jgi:hypothetical protein
MMSLSFPPIEVDRWSPTIRLSDRIDPSPSIETFGHRAPARIRPTAISFSAPQPMLVTGHRFTVVTAADGLLAASLYLSPDPAWPALLNAETALIPAGDRPLLIASNAAWINYSHWLFQSFATALVADRLAPHTDFDILSPPLDEFKAAAFALAGISIDRIVQLPAGGVILPSAGIHTNLTDGGFIPAPHPEIVHAMAAVGEDIPVSALAGRRVYIARSDSRNRRMENEPAVCEALRRRGFEIILPTGQPLEEQISLFRDAALIVAPHGAGLTNLGFVREGRGPAVVELFQENFLNLAFAKICQIKRLHYTALINPVHEWGDGRHGSTWTADISALLEIVDTL